MHDFCSIAVFREVKIDSQLFFQWFRIGQDNESFIVPESLLLTEDQHWQKFNLLFT